MSTTLLVTMPEASEADAVQGNGVEVLTRYPDTMLVVATDDEAAQLADRAPMASATPTRWSLACGARCRSTPTVVVRRVTHAHFATILGGRDRQRDMPRGVSPPARAEYRVRHPRIPPTQRSP